MELNTRKYSIYWYNFEGKITPCLIQGSFLEMVQLAKDLNQFVNNGRKYIIKEVPPIDKPKYIGYY